MTAYDFWRDVMREGYNMMTILLALAMCVVLIAVYVSPGHTLTLRMGHLEETTELIIALGWLSITAVLALTSLTHGDLL